MRWTTPLKATAAAAMLAAGIWLAGIADEDVPRRANAVQHSVSRPVSGQGSQSAPCTGLKGLVVPVQGIRKEQLTDTFRDARAEHRRHDAIDIMAPRGTPVIAAAAGRVEKLFLSDAGGTTVYVRSADGRVIYYYAHLDHYAAGLKEGQNLRQGALIGAVGSTGNANPEGPHLHFAVTATVPEKPWWEEAEALNPYPLLTGSGAAARAELACR